MRKQLNTDDLSHFELLKIGRNSRVESGINAALTVALSSRVGRMPYLKLKFHPPTVQNTDNLGVSKGKTSVK